MSNKFKTGDKVVVAGGGPQVALWVVGYTSMGRLVLVDPTDTDLHMSIVRDEKYYELVREPIKIEGWVNVYPATVDYFFYETRYKADDEARPNRIACIYVSGEEGKEP